MSGGGRPPLDTQRGGLQGEAPTATRHRAPAARRPAFLIAPCFCFSSPILLGELLALFLELFVESFPRCPELLGFLLGVGCRASTATAPEAGKAEYQEESQRADEPRYLHQSLAPCWSSVIRSSRRSCSDGGEDSRHGKIDAA